MGLELENIPLEQLRGSLAPPWAICSLKMPGVGSGCLFLQICFYSKRVWVRPRLGSVPGAGAPRMWMEVSGWQEKNEIKIVFGVSVLEMAGPCRT